MTTRFERAVSALLGICGFAIAATYVTKSFITPSSAPNTSQSPSRVRGWEAAATLGWKFEYPDSPVTIVVIEDLECPVCAGYHKTVGSVAQAESVSLVHVLYPLTYHKSAMPAARAAICAAELGRFGQWLDVVYSKQDSLSIKSWTSYVQDAGIRDTARIASCAADTTQVTRLSESIAYGDQMGLTGTPSTIVNGWRLSNTPSKAELTRIVSAFRRGENPFSFWATLTGKF